MSPQAIVNPMLDQAYRALFTGNIETALSLAWQINSRSPGQAVVLRLLGLAYSLKGDAFNALCQRFLSEAKERGADDVDVHLGLARTWLGTERFTEAHQALDDAVRTADAPQREVVQFQRGLCFAVECNWTEAARQFETLLASSAFERLATGWLGVIAACRGEDAQALGLFERLSLDDAASADSDHFIFQCHYRDILANREPHAFPKRILILRHPFAHPYFYQVFLDWTARNYPEYRTAFEFRLLPCPPLDFDRYALHLPWLQDPVQNWSRLAYDQACEIEAEFTQRGIRVINRVSKLSNAGKLEGAARIASCGLRTPRMVAIKDSAAFRRDRGGLDYPFFIREDWGHGGAMERIETDAQLAGFDPARFRRPIAVELIDVRSSDGLYRKYRYIAIGDYGISHHLLSTEHWITRGAERIYNPQTRAEELDYIARPDPHHSLFQRARRAQELDFVAFDYGVDRDGRVVVWEANPYPLIHWPKSGGKSEFRVAALHRTLAAMLLFYLEQAGISAPAELRLVTDYDPAGESRLAAFARP